MDACRLFLCGFAALFWELVLIRWLGATLRVVAYFSNLVLISAFFGLGAGALLARFPVRLERLIAPFATVMVLLGAWLAGRDHPNPRSALEFIWNGIPMGLQSDTDAGRVVPVAILLLAVYGGSAVLFSAFGQYMGRLFRSQPPLRAYSIEIAGSLAGVVVFALMSQWQASPLTWFALGALLILAMVPWRTPDAILTVGLAGVMLWCAAVEERGITWSPYYRIWLRPLTRITEMGTWRPVEFAQPVGHVLTVNNDYHQMMLDLRPGTANEHTFLTGWRLFYDAPYASHDGLPAIPPGPILVVGAGTGNDVAAALRNTDRPVTAVEIDPAIAGLGARLHAEHPYSSPRVTLVVDDARSFFHHARDGQFAAVVFGFLDSHTLLSAFGSVRLDNFIYTREAMEEAHRLLAPGGRIALSFAANRWIDRRLRKLLEPCFGTVRPVEDPTGYANGTLYLGVRSDAPRKAPVVTAQEPPVPTDDWPFLYLRERGIPGHCLVFLGIVLTLSLGALLLLPKGERRIRMPYLLLGAAFFLLETSNVVRMALLFGSTWRVNSLVFGGILVLVLLANLTATRWRVPIPASIAALALGILSAAILPTQAFLALGPWPRAAAAVVVLLGPVYFGSLIFARLIENEPRLYEAYGSNLLGAVLGGAAEYLSLLAGFRLLLVLALACYLGVFALLRARGSASQTVPIT